jgi:hypothetical protein
MGLIMILALRWLLERATADADVPLGLATWEEVESLLPGSEIG